MINFAHAIDTAINVSAVIIIFFFIVLFIAMISEIKTMHKEEETQKENNKQK